VEGAGAEVRFGQLDQLRLGELAAEGAERREKLEVAAL
jgi:hypothetical protein